jgi:hypothetical protein
MLDVGLYETLNVEPLNPKTDTETKKSKQTPDKNRIHYELDV